MTTNHEPTPEFARFLEWQVTSALRRQDRFAQPAPSGSRRYLPLAAAAVLSLFVGAALGAAPHRIQDNRQRTQLLQLQQADLQVAEMQRSLAEQALQNVKRRADVGVAGQDEVEAAQRELQDATLKVRRVQVNVDEVQRSGRAVQDDLTSPLVGGHDFVVDRLTLEQQSAAMAAASAERRARAVRKRQEAGVATDLELLDAQAGVVRAYGDVKSAGDKIALRQQFLAGKLTAAAVTRERLLLAARTELAAASSDLAVMEKRYTLLQTQVKVGMANEVDMLKAQVEMLTRQQDVKRLQARIASLEQDRRE